MDSKLLLSLPAMSIGPQIPAHLLEQLEKSRADEPTTDAALVRVNILCFSLSEQDLNYMKLGVYIY